MTNMEETSKDANRGVYSKFYIFQNKSSEESFESKLISMLSDAQSYWAVFAVANEDDSSFLVYKSHSKSPDNGIGNFVDGIYINRINNDLVTIDVTGSYFETIKGSILPYFKISQEEPTRFMKLAILQLSELYAEDYAALPAKKFRREGFCKTVDIKEIPSELQKLEEILYERKL
jgi:hypothetical protein